MIIRHHIHRTRFSFDIVYTERDYRSISITSFCPLALPYPCNPSTPHKHTTQLSPRRRLCLPLKIPDSRGYYPGEKGYRPDQVASPQGQGGAGQEQQGYMEGSEAFVPDGYGGFVRRQNPPSPQGKNKVRPYEKGEKVGFLRGWRFFSSFFCSIIRRMCRNKAEAV